MGSVPGKHVDKSFKAAPHNCCSQTLLTLVPVVLAQQVAGAVLVIACLLNAPPSFLEFLLCIPWRHLGDLYPR